MTTAIHSERQKQSDINDSVHSEKMGGDIGVHVPLNQSVRNQLKCRSDLLSSNGSEIPSPPPCNA